MVQERDDVVGLDSAILMAPKVWEASGHLATFTDPLVDCRNCKERFRADQLPESGACPNCGAKDSFTEARNFNLMFKTHVGPVEDDAVGGVPAARRPRRASSSTSRTCRRRAARSRRSASRRSASRSATRSRRATSSSAPASSSRWRWSSSCRRRTRERGTSTGARSASAGTWTSASPRRCCGCARTTPTSSRTTASAPPTWSSSTRGAGASSRASRTAPTTTSPSTPSSRARTSRTSTRRHDRRYVPYVIEPAAGADRATLAFLLAAYHEEEAPTADGKVEKRTVLRLDPRLAPIKVAVLPLSKKDELVAGHRPGRRRSAPPLHDRRRPRRVDRPALPAPGRGRHAAVRHDRLRHARRRRGHRARPRLDGPGAASPIDGLVDVRAADKGVQ